MQKEIEIWKDIKGYEGYYQVSNLGRVKSLSRKVWIEKNNSFGIRKEKILKYNKKYRNYAKVTLTKNKIVKYFNIHQLIAIVFLNHTPDKFNELVVDHIDFDRQNNKLSNLRLITQRKNTNKC